MLLIYVLDDKGRRDKSEVVLIDATLQGADALMELAASHVHRLGAALASEGSFGGDGADWSWDRIPLLMKRVGLPSARWYKAVNISHARGPIHDALEACKDLTPQERRRKLPIGSGAVESAIRRVLNLRIHGAGSFWNEDNLEKVTYMRAQVLSGRWDEMMAGGRDHSQRTRNLAWRWKPTLTDEPNHQQTQPTADSNVNRAIA